MLLYQGNSGPTSRPAGFLSPPPFPPSSPHTLSHLLHPVQAAYVVQRVQCGGQTTVQAEDLAAAAHPATAGQVSVCSEQHQCCVLTLGQQQSISDRHMKQANPSTTAPAVPPPQDQSPNLLQAAAPDISTCGPLPLPQNTHQTAHKETTQSERLLHPLPPILTLFSMRPVSGR